LTLFTRSYQGQQNYTVLRSTGVMVSRYCTDLLATQHSEAWHMLWVSLSISMSYSWVMPTRFKVSKHALHHTTEEGF